MGQAFEAFAKKHERLFEQQLGAKLDKLRQEHVEDLKVIDQVKKEHSKKDSPKDETQEVVAPVVPVVQPDEAKLEPTASSTKYPHCSLHPLLWISWHF